MAIRYYDDAVVDKIERVFKDNQKIRVLRPDETRELLRMKADLNDDKPLALPFLAISRSTDIELSQPTARPLSYDGKILAKNECSSAQLNAIPINLTYQLDIYTRREEEGDAFLRELLFYLINYPRIKILIPYNGSQVTHVANIRVMTTISDNSDISERLYKDEFTRWTIGFELQDAYLFSIPYNKNWRIVNADLEMINSKPAANEKESINFDVEV